MATAPTWQQAQEGFELAFPHLGEYCQLLAHGKVHDKVTATIRVMFNPDGVKDL